MKAWPPVIPHRRWSDLSEDHYPAALMYSQRACPCLDDGECTRVPDGETRARASGDVELATGGAVEHGVAHQDRIPGVVGRRDDHDTSAVHALAHVVVGFADEGELDPLARKAPKDCPACPTKRTRASRAASLAEVVSDLAAELGPHRAVGVGDG